MEKYSTIFKLTFKYWKLMVFGMITMILFALFNSVSITLAIPMFDYVFGDKTTILYNDLTSLVDAIHLAAGHYVNFSFFELFNSENHTVFIDKMNLILMASSSLLLLKIISTLLVSLIFLKNIFFYTNKIIFVNLRGKTIMDIRAFLYRKYLYQSYSFFNKNRVGDSLVRIYSDVRIVNDNLIGSLFNGSRDLINIIFLGSIAFLISPKLFLYSLLIIPAFTYFLSKIGKKVKKYAKRIQNQSSNLFSRIEEVLNGIRIVKAFSKEEYEFDMFSRINRKFFEYWRKAELYSSANVPLSEINGVLTAVLILIVGGYILFEPGSTLTTGKFFAFLGAMLSMLHPFKTLSKSFNNIKKAKVSIDRVAEIINTHSEITEPPDPVHKSDFSTSIELKNVSFSYNKNDTILDDISFSINKGEKIALVGSSGSGKTTITNLVSRMYDVTDGEITIDGINIKRFFLKDLRALFGTVTQESILFNDTILNNIAYGSVNEAGEEKITKAAKIAYADEFIEKLPKKYNEMLNSKANNLSGGQKQRLCIARAIVGDPPILIFDEATSALDTESEQKVQMAIEHATENKTVIVVAHRLSTILSSDKIIVLDQGKIAGMGKHDELMKSNDRYRYFYNLQFK